MAALTTGRWHPDIRGTGKFIGFFGPSRCHRTTIYSPDAQSLAPRVEGTTLDGKQLSLADLSGDLVVLNVWGSWCGPCRGEAPVLARVAGEFAAQGVRLVGIDTHDTSASATAFEHYFKIPYPSIIDTNGRVLLKLKDLIPISGIPSTLIVDPAGGIAARIVGPTDYPTLHRLIAAELTTPRLAPAPEQGQGGKS